MKLGVGCMQGDLEPLSQQPQASKDLTFNHVRGQEHRSEGRRTEEVLYFVTSCGAPSHAPHPLAKRRALLPPTPAAPAPTHRSPSLPASSHSARLALKRICRPPHQSSVTTARQNVLCSLRKDRRRPLRRCRRPECLCSSVLQPVCRHLLQGQRRSFL